MHGQAGRTEKSNSRHDESFRRRCHTCYFFVFFSFCCFFFCSGYVWVCMWGFVNSKRSVSYRKSSIDKNVETRAKRVPRVWQSGFWCGPTWEVFTLLFISIYTCGVFLCEQECRINRKITDINPVYIETCEIRWIHPGNILNLRDQIFNLRTENVFRHPEEKLTSRCIADAVVAAGAVAHGNQGNQGERKGNLHLHIHLRCGLCSL